MESAPPTYVSPVNEIGMRRVLPIIAGAGIVLGALVSFASVPLPPCPFKTLFHLPCPGCGMTRSVAALMHGNLALSFRYQPLGSLLFAGAVSCLALPLLPTELFRQVASRLPRQQVVAGGILAVVLGVWLLRLAFIFAGSRFFLW